MSKKWHKLDNASKLFSAVATEKNSAVFRVSATLEKAIDRVALQHVTDQVIQRFPGFGYTIKSGFFWNYLEQNPQKVKIEKETPLIGAPFDLTSYDEHLIRVLYYHNKLSIEVSHIVSDGAGALEFFKVLLFYYLKEIGCQLDDRSFLFKLNEEPKLEEWEDSFKRYATAEETETCSLPNAYRLNGTSLREVEVIHGTVSLTELKKCAASHDLNMTAFLASLLIYSCYQTKVKETQTDDSVVVSIPVNLRGLFPSKTLTNFFGTITVEVKGTKELTLPDICEVVRAQFKNRLTKENLQRMINENVEMESKQYSRLTPLVIKEQVMRLAFAKRGEQKKTLTFSNLGAFQVPQELQSHIKAINVVSYPTSNVPINCCAISYNDNMAITFVRNISETDVIQYFFSYLSQSEKVRVEISTS
ncbi:hypothetical protein OL233_06320 [Vagococcus sp. PNs007]|uniref:Alcohol acetyltransferase n=1 Tax=Vagococcus proximus TaxID=2991417 RepID=A0ABT5X1N6_9ENTE|nr:hypothetical protein [Vagococcus proximus]MDF0479904.1 hypothetical protein [Vagococcus proximus]